MNACARISNPCHTEARTIMAKRLLLIILLPTLSFAYTPAAQFLCLPYSAIGHILEEPSSATPSIDGFVYNPASLPTEHGFCGKISYMRYFLKIDQYSLLASYNFGRFRVGLSFKSLNISDIEKRDTPTSEPDFVFSTHHLAAGLHTSYEILNHISIGGAIVRTYEDIDYYENEATLYNLGLLVHIKDAGASASVTNLGNVNQVRAKAYNGPLTYQGSIYYVLPMDLMNGRLALHLSFVKPDYTKYSIKFGAAFSYSFATFIACYKTGIDSKGFSIGFGLRKGLWNFNYAFTPYKNSLGSAHQISLGLSR